MHRGWASARASWVGRSVVGGGGGGGGMRALAPVACGPGMGGNHCVTTAPVTPMASWCEACCGGAACWGTPAAADLLVSWWPPSRSEWMEWQLRGSWWRAALRSRGRHGITFVILTPHNAGCQEHDPHGQARCLQGGHGHQEATGGVLLCSEASEGGGLANEGCWIGDGAPARALAGQALTAPIRRPCRPLWQQLWQPWLPLPSPPPHRPHRRPSRWQRCALAVELPRAPRPRIDPAASGVSVRQWQHWGGLSCRRGRRPGGVRATGARALRGPARPGRRPATRAAGWQGCSQISQRALDLAAAAGSGRGGARPHAAVLLPTPPAPLPPPPSSPAG
jgi:hypothetical protein